LTSALPRHRLFLEGPLAAGSRRDLDAERSHYLCRVLRARAGDAIVVFSGDGFACDAEVVVASTRCAGLVVGERCLTEAAPAFELELGLALIKGDRLDFVLQKSTELGITRITLMSTEHSVVNLTGERIERRLEHWRRIVIGACEQSGRLWLPRLSALTDFVDVVAAPAGNRYLLDPGAPPLAGVPPAADTRLLLGPEGGFSAREQALAVAKGYVPLGLGDRILRSDTAPVAAIAVLRQAWGWRLP
jgi:16S rRNA (uracil1498-N3)-methyltransferase